MNQRRSQKLKRIAAVLLVSALAVICVRIRSPKNVKQASKTVANTSSISSTSVVSDTPSQLDSKQPRPEIMLNDQDDGGPVQFVTLEDLSTAILGISVVPKGSTPSVSSTLKWTPVLDVTTAPDKKHTRRIFGKGSNLTQTITVPLRELGQPVTSSSQGSKLAGTQDSVGISDLVFYVRPSVIGVSNPAGSDINSKTLDDGPWTTYRVRSIAHIKRGVHIPIMIQVEDSPLPKQITTSNDQSKWLVQRPNLDRNRSMAIDFYGIDDGRVLWTFLKHYQYRFAWIDEPIHTSSQKEPNTVFFCNNSHIAKTLFVGLDVQDKSVETAANQMNASIVYKGAPEDLIVSWADGKDTRTVPESAWNLDSWTVYNGVSGEWSYAAHPRFASQDGSVEGYVTSTAVALFRRPVEIIMMPHTRDQTKFLDIGKLGAQIPLDNQFSAKPESLPDAH